MRILTVIFYFIITIVIFASAGVVIPYIFESIRHVPHNSQDFSQNVVTYFIAIFASASLDLVLKFIDRESAQKKLLILGLLLICIIVVGLTALLLYYNANGSKDLIKWLVIGTVVSYIMWWIAHFRDEVFNPPVNSLGGNPNKPLRNG